MLRHKNISDYLLIRFPIHLSVQCLLQEFQYPISVFFRTMDMKSRIFFRLHLKTTTQIIAILRYMKKTYAAFPHFPILSFTTALYGCITEYSIIVHSIIIDSSAHVKPFICHSSTRSKSIFPLLYLEKSDSIRYNQN